MMELGFGDFEPLHEPCSLSLAALRATFQVRQQSTGFLKTITTKLGNIVLTVNTTSIEQESKQTFGKTNNSILTQGK